MQNYLSKRECLGLGQKTKRLGFAFDYFKTKSTGSKEGQGGGLHPCTLHLRDLNPCSH